MVTEDQSPVAVEPVVQAPPAAVEPTPAPIQATQEPPAPVLPINVGALKHLQQQQAQEPLVRVIQPRPDGTVPINNGRFVVATAVVPAADPATQPIPEPTPAAPIQAPPSGAGSVADPNPIQTPAAQPVANAEWETLTGGRLKTASDWETFQAEQARLAEEVQQLTATRVEFANPLVAKLNEVFKNGGDLATASSLLAAQSLDPAAMKPLEAIKAAISFQHPDLDHEEVEAHISRLGIDLSDMDGAGTRAALKTEAAKANQYLAGLKVQMDNPAVLAQAQESQAAAARNQEAWKAVPAPAQVTKVTEKVGDIAISVDYAFSAEANAFAAQITNEMRSLPANQQNIQNFHALYETLARGFDSQRMVAQVAAEAARVATVEALKRVAGPTPPPVTQAQIPEPVKQKHQGHYALGES